MSKELKTGIVVVLIIIAFIWGFNFLKGHDIFQPRKRSFFVEYKNVGGLTEASVVTINGLKVGKVDDINFINDEERLGHLLVKFSMDNDFEFSKKSIVRIYSPNPLSGSNLAIIPSYEDDIAVNGDYLNGEVETGIFSSIGARLDPIQIKLERVLVSADTLFHRVNNVLDYKTTESIKTSVENIEYTIADLRKTLVSLNTMIDSNAKGLKESIENTNQITQNLVKVSDTLANLNFGEIMRKAEYSLTSVNKILDGVNSGQGTAGKLLHDDELYRSLTQMSQELEELLREMKLNPKRFVHFSLFGKKAKPYIPEQNEEIKD